MSGNTVARSAGAEPVRWSHRITVEDVEAYTRLSGDTNPIHVDDAYAQRLGFRGRVVHGMLLCSYLSRLLGTVFPGPGTLWLSQTTRFRRPVYVGDTIQIELKVLHESESLGSLVLEAIVSNQRGETVLTGESKLMVLEQAQQVPWTERVAVVTGAGRGIGAAIARALGVKGARVLVNYRQRHETAAEVVSAIEASGGTAKAVQADVSTVSGAQALAESALDAFGRADIVVNSATPRIARTPFLDLEWEEIDQYWNTYVQSAFTVAKGLVPGMKERRFGRIVNVLTSAIWANPPHEWTGYVAAKSGLWGLTKAMAVELAPFGITVNAVSPSTVPTEQWDDWPDSRRRARAMSIPLRRLATPDEVAKAVLFLLGDGADYLTGTNLPVAGGEVM